LVWLLLSDGSHGDSDETNTKTSTDGVDDNDDSQVDDDEDENDDYLKEFESGKTRQLCVISCEYGISVIWLITFPTDGKT